jgi:histidinol phosphatase-like PHP family hydrolase
VSKKRTHPQMQWYSIDLHLHTPASSDFQQADIKYLEVLQRAEARSLDIIAFTDHNTISGYKRFKEDIHQLELLEKLKVKKDAKLEDITDLQKKKLNSFLMFKLIKNGCEKNILDGIDCRNGLWVCYDKRLNKRLDVAFKNGKVDEKNSWN